MDFECSYSKLEQNNEQNESKSIDSFAEIFNKMYIDLNILLRSNQYKYKTNCTIVFLIILIILILIKCILHIMTQLYFTA